MPRSRRSVRERDPEVITFTLSLLRPLWALIALWYMAVNMGPLFFPSAPSSRGGQLDQTPLEVGAAVTVVIFCIAAVVLWIETAAGKRVEDLQSMSPSRFEDWVACRFRELGYSVKTSGSQGDHGADLVLEAEGKRAVVQCKNYKAWSVGEPALRDLYGTMHDFGADEAYLVTTGHVTEAARKWVLDKPIAIWDGEHLARLSKHAGPMASFAASTSAPASVPTCPRCGSYLVQRRNRSTGEPFLGCNNFPNCRYTRPLSKRT